jgi:UDP-N-acetylmuramate--alanine ligase
MVAEADESDGSFLRLWPSIAVITNIDREHMESYGSFAKLQQAFADFANKVPFYGAVIACIDDANVVSILTRVQRRLVTYGLDSPSAHFAATEVELGAFGGRCVVHRRRDNAIQRLGGLEVALPGRHNLQNAVAAVAAASQVGLAFDSIAGALKTFEGPERRFEKHGEVGSVLVVDDYAHHPTEIAAVLAAARISLGRRLIVVFQPHRYSRTRDLMNEFGQSLKAADVIVLTDIYAAGEDPIPGVTMHALADAILQAAPERPVRIAPRIDDVVPEVLKVARAGDAVITLGAGSIGTLPKRLIEALRQREVNA